MHALMYYYVMIVILLNQHMAFSLLLSLFFPLTLPFECDNHMRKRRLFYVFLNQEHGYMVNMFSTN